ncbi:MAG: HlyD family efflux transporter periplasmic adaptor subunit [Mongoliibacter sp.]|uniref:efflux RND transporter periplasmic adaptor subunit n=1 Tax=Mongoliibacter sp. TaxID=2022438 RepID=UPI0012F2F121|nr:efflux RND transporter periplasmic adaptor subunit [Mongoliibacter sp.]TVP43663.1 MAG: HlyD family efflux transporter periplasmic adaptor subunit [Mongoliibacter sp.]
MYSKKCFWQLFGIFLIFSCSPSGDKTIPLKEHMTESIYASGTVKARFQYQAYTNAVGTIQEVFLQEGDTVDVGTPILSISSESTRINRQTSELNREYADRQANQTRLRDLEININYAANKRKNDSLLFERQKRLMSQGIGTAVDLEQRELAFENSLTLHQATQLKYEDLKREIDFNERSATKNLAISKALESDLILKSEVRGVLYSLLREKGEMVNNQTPLAVLGSGEEFVLEMLVDEYDIAKVKRGQKILISMDSYRGEVFEALVTKINPIMDVGNKTFVVEGIFVEQPTVLYPNLSLEANIVIYAKENALTIPRSFVFKDRYVITEKKDTIEVKLGLKDFQKVEILEGIDENTVIVKPGT